MFSNQILKGGPSDDYKSFSPFSTRPNQNSAGTGEVTLKWWENFLGVVEVKKTVLVPTESGVRAQKIFSKKIFLNLFGGHKVDLKVGIKFFW